MRLKPIESERDYRDALAEIEKLMDGGPDTPAGERLKALTMLVEAYEEKRFPIDLPGPLTATGFRAARQGDNPEPERQMKLAEKIMRDDRALLRKLAK